MLFVVPAAYRTGCAAREMNKGTGMRGESRRGRTVTAAVSAEAVSVGESQSLGGPEKAGYGRRGKPRRRKSEDLQRALRVRRTWVGHGK